MNAQGYLVIETGGLHEHQVHAATFERDRRAGAMTRLIEFAHARHIVLDNRLVHFDNAELRARD